MSARAGSLRMRVVSVEAVTPLIKRFRLEPLDGERVPLFSAGSHVTIEIPDGGGVRRNAYSLMGSPRDPSRYEISVRRDEAGRGGSRLMHDTVSPGMVLTVGHPANLFPIARHGRKHLLVAGGVGITPFLPVCEQLADEAIPFELHYAVRSRTEGAYVEELCRRFGPSVTIYAGENGERLDIAALLSGQPLGTHLYVCGPARLSDAVLVAALDAGWPRSALHAERFTAPPPGKPFSLRLARSGFTVEVGPDQSMLEAIEAAGIESPYLCRGGACGQCEARVIEHDGTLLHADHYLSEAERGSGRSIMPCVSRFEGRCLVIDL